MMVVSSKHQQHYLDSSLLFSLIDSQLVYLRLVDYIKHQFLCIKEIFRAHPQRALDKLSLKSMREKHQQERIHFYTTEWMS